jgi:hypothetical protein
MPSLMMSVRTDNLLPLLKPFAVLANSGGSSRTRKRMPKRYTGSARLVTIEDIHFIPPIPFSIIDIAAPFFSSFHRDHHRIYFL